MNSMLQKPAAIFVSSLLIIGSVNVQAIVGYVNVPFGSGSTLFANPLQTTSNTLTNLFAGGVPNGTTVSLWNPTTLSYDTTSTYNIFLGGWSLNLTLNPGTGAKLTTSGTFTNTFVGEVLNHAGLPPTLDELNNGFLPAPLYAGPNGLFLLGDKAPMGATGNDIFLNIFGRAPIAGEQVIKLSSTSTYLGGGTWDLLPTLSVGEAAFFNIGPVPEPSSLALFILGFAMLRSLGRRARG